MHCLWICVRLEITNWLLQLHLLLGLSLILYVKILTNKLLHFILKLGGYSLRHRVCNNIFCSMARVTHGRSVGRGPLDIIIWLKSAYMFRLYHLRHFYSYSSLHPFVKCYIFINILANGRSCWEDSFTDLYLIWCNKLADRSASYGSNWSTSALDHL